METTINYAVVTCTHCGQPFTETEWEKRHWGHEEDCPGENCDCDLKYHERCCPDCNPPRKSPEEVEALKANWQCEPCWEIEETEGFEAHYDELREYRLQKEAEWEERSRQALQNYAKKMGVPDNPTLASYLMSLEARIEQLQRKLEEGQTI